MALSRSISVVAGLSRRLVIAPFIACLIVLLSAPAAKAHFVAEGLAIEGEWVGLEARDAELVARRPILVAKLTNREPVPIRVRLKVAITIDGRRRPLRKRRFQLAPQETVLKRVRLPRRFVNLQDFEFSGRVSMTANAKPVGSDRLRDDAATGHADQALGLPTVWFHVDRGSFRFYREDVMRNVYDGGNYRGTELNVFDSSFEMQDAIAQVTGRSNVLPVLAHVALGGGTTGGNDFLPPGSRKFCLVIDGFAFVDSTRPWKNFGEDLGHAGTLIPLPRAWVALGQNGSGLYTGFLDSEGCTPPVVTNTTVPVSVAFIPMAHNPFGNRLFVSDLNLGAQWPNSMPFFLLFFDVVDEPVNFLELDTYDFVPGMFAAAANCLERAPGGLMNTLYEYQVRLAGDNNGTKTNYGDGGHPRVQVEFTPEQQSKFTLCHEYAHAMNIAELVPPLPLNETGIDYTVEAMESEGQHTLTSKEWNLAAAIEGFAHFVSATVWNDVSTGAGGVYVDGAGSATDSEPYPLDTFDQLFLNDYGASGNLGQGVELDWAQFFWAWHTDNVEPQSVPTMIAIWYEAYQPWPVNLDFYATFESAASSVLADQDELDRMIDLRIDAGIVP